MSEALKISPFADAAVDYDSGNWGPGGGALTISYEAVENTRHCIAGIAWSFRHTPSEVFDAGKGATLSIYTGDEWPTSNAALIAEFWITKSGFDSILFPRFKAAPVGGALNIRLSDLESNWATLLILDRISQVVG
jgi:hypothetical protein